MQTKKQTSVGKDPFLIDWKVIGNRNGVILQSWGEGIPLVVIPGLEGSGESCLHLVIPSVEVLVQNGMATQVCLVNYAREEHETLEALTDTIQNLLRDAFGKQEILVFSQSFGNLISSSIAIKKELEIKKILMVSPFTKLPELMVRLSAFSMKFTPTFLYRSTIKPLGKYVFGPVGKNSGHIFFDALQRATSSQVKRQTSWLVGLDYSKVFEKIKVPVKIVLGEKDRLININQQIGFFESLCSEQNNKVLATLRDSGHVLLQNAVIEEGKEHFIKYFEE